MIPLCMDPNIRFQFYVGFVKSKFCVEIQRKVKYPNIYKIIIGYCLFFMTCIYFMFNIPIVDYLETPIKISD